MTQNNTNIFQDQKKFMEACDQTTDKLNKDQFKLYYNLIKEESKELEEAISKNDRKEILDALIDILVVTTGAIHSGGFDGEGAWQEVMKTNFAKIDQQTCKVKKREDGKVLKPEGWKAPELESFIKEKDKSFNFIQKKEVLCAFDWKGNKIIDFSLNEDFSEITLFIDSEYPAKFEKTNELQLSDLSIFFYDKITVYVKNIIE